MDQSDIERSIIKTIVNATVISDLEIVTFLGLLLFKWAVKVGKLAKQDEWMELLFCTVYQNNRIPVYRGSGEKQIGKIVEYRIVL